MADVPFLGCKISLISKCDIRYEGILYCVDPKESTISLSKVRSYGTETRGDPASFVPPKNDVYDVIIFRASDVKDLRVDTPEPPGLSDPAIISARQSSNSTFDANPNGSLPTSSGPSHQQSHQGHQQKPLLPFLPTGSGKDQQQSQQSQPVVNYSSAVSSNAQRRSRPDNRNKSDNEVNNRKSDVSSGRDASRRGGDGGDRRSDKRDNDRRDDRRGRVSNDRRDYNNHHHQQQQQNHDGGRRGDSRPQPRMNRGGYERNHVNNNSRYNNSASNRRGPSQRDDDSKGPMNRRRGPMQGGRRGRSGDRTGAPRGPRKSAPLKFEGEYDFDEANKLFMQLEGKMKNLKLKDGQKDENGESSGDRANSKSPNGQSESGSGYDSDDRNHKDVDSKDGGFGGSVSGEYYDKSKSFFDNISCEASDRTQGKMGKPDWRKERQTNAETFGISANYRSRGGYRGRSYGANGYHRR